MKNFFVLNKKKIVTIPLLTILAVAIIFTPIFILIDSPDASISILLSIIAGFSGIQIVVGLILGFIFHETERMHYKKILSKNPFNSLFDLGFQFQNHDENHWLNFTSQQLTLILVNYKIVFILPDTKHNKDQVILRAFAKVPDPENSKSEFNQDALEQGFKTNWFGLDKIYNQKAQSILTSEQIQTDLNDMVRLLQKFQCKPSR